MENTPQGPSKGYQKQVQKTKTDAPKKAKSHVDYSSPTAKKWPLMVEALNSGNIDTVKQLIEEGVNVNLLRDGVTPLMIAASKGHTAVAEVIIQAGVNINERSDDGGTALHMAASDQSDTAVVELLLQSGIDAEAKNKFRKTALQKAEEKGHHDIVRVIKKHQELLLADAREWRDFLNTPEGYPYKQKKRYETLSSLFNFWWLPPAVLGGAGILLGLVLGVVVIAAFIGEAAGLLVVLFLYLLQKKVRSYLDTVEPLPDLDIHILREKRKSGEPIAVEQKSETETTDSEDIIDAELFDPSAEEQTAESASLDEGNEQEPTERKKKVNPKVIVFTSVGLVMAALIGTGVIYRVSLAQWYFAKKLERKDIPFSGQSFLAEVAKNNEDAVDLFIKAGIDPASVDEKGRTALHIASEQGFVNMLGKLVVLNPALLQRTDKSGSTALMAAARKGQESSVKSLVASGADVNFRTPSREAAATALQAAVSGSNFNEAHMRIVQYLLQKGADAKGKNESGPFPLLFAASNGRTDVAALLIEKGAEVNDADGAGNFPLLTAACHGHAGLVAFLVEKGANVKMAAPDGQTPLLCAVHGGHIDTVKALLEKGADVNTKAADGLTALSDATRAGNAAVASLLLAHGADPSHGYLPGEFTDLNGKTISLAAKKEKLTSVLRRIGMTAAQDGYVINFDYKSAQKISMKAKASWNKALQGLAAKNRLLLVVKEKEVSVLPYASASVKRKTN
jgi:ankyrin repeat protein